MITNEERKDIARRLRDNKHEDWKWVVPWALYNDGEDHYEPFVQMRLAELIDPSDTTESCRDNAACDRDALLTLADECDKAFSVNRASAYDEIARRIREACGE